MVNRIMTIYTINNQCTYDDKTHEIKNLKSSDRLIMTSMRVRCLRYMRRDLRECGLHDFLSTIPRLGVKVNADIIINKPVKKLWLHQRLCKNILFITVLIIFSVLAFIFIH